MLAAGRGCYGIFHLASPCTVDRVLDPQVLLLRDRPAVIPSEFRPLSTGWRLSHFVVAEGAGSAGRGRDAPCAFLGAGADRPVPPPRCTKFASLSPLCCKNSVPLLRPFFAPWPSMNLNPGNWNDSAKDQC
ncbi:hypothetical protein VPH35_021162 [Triticum aestivum]